MRCLSEEECVSWVKKHDLAASPYGDWEGYPFLATGHYHQFGIKDTRSFIAQHLVELICPFEEALLWVIDWSVSHPSLDALVNAVRRSHGEYRPFGAVPGHLYDSEERDELAGLFFLTMELGGSAYLYVAGSGTIFLNWEGELLDAWTKDADHTEKIALIEADWREEISGDNTRAIIIRGGADAGV